MSVSLAWRLVLGGLASEDEVEVALRAQLTGELPFLRAMVGRSPNVSRALERERPEGDAAVAVDRELATHLSREAMATLLAVPMGRDPETGIAIAGTVDPLDRHVSAELEFHLGEPVALVPVSLEAVLAAVRDMGAADGRAAPRASGPRIPPSATVPVVPGVVARPPPVRRGGTPAFGTPAVGTRPSEPPIPLVRVAPSVAPGMVTTSSLDEESEPVLSLTRSKSPSEAPVAVALERIAAAETPDAVVQRLVEALGEHARAVVAFSVRAGGYRGRECAGELDADAARAVEIAAGQPSILRTASDIGHYVGPIPLTDSHRDLAEVLGEHGGEVAVHAVTVGGRPAVLVVLGGMTNVYAVTGTAERLVRAAGKTLEELLRARKR